MIPIDITPDDLETVRLILREGVPSLEVRVFGSRASWTARETSDLDLVLMTEKPLDISRMAKLKESFSESNIPFQVDIVDWADTSENFRKIIEKDYVVLRKKSKNIRKMESKWRNVVLADCAEVIHQSVSPFKAKDMPYIGLEHIGRGSLRLLGQGTASDVTSMKTRFQHNDILFGKLRPYFRKVVMPCFDGICSTDIWVIRAKKGTDQKFLFYFMASKPFIDFATSSSDGTRMPRAKWEYVSQYEIQVPPLVEQYTIAHVLSTLDDKIELNCRMSKTLETIARALFKSWFVDFDPVRAKMEGRWHRGKSLPGLPAHLYDIFPNRLVDSELGQIPDNWEIKTLKDLCHKPQYGYTESARDEPVGPKFLRITDINKKSWIDWRTVPYCKITEKNFDKYRLRKGDIIIARIADPGQGVMIEEDREAVFASYLIRFRPIDRVHARILQYWLRSDKYWELVMERSTGTTRANLNAKVMSDFPLVVPSAPISEAFNKYINSIRTRVVKNALESHSLKTVRDTLLPELMSGKLDIKKTKQKGLRT